VAELEPENVTDSGVNRWPLVLAVGGGLILFFYLLEPILLPFVLGGLIGYLGDPLVDALERRRVNRTLGVVVVFLIISALIVAAMVFAVPMLLEQLDILARKIPQLYQWVTEQAVPWLQRRLNLPASSFPAIDWSGQLADNWQSVGKMTATTIRQITGSGMNILLGLANLALVPVVAFYLMRDWDILMDKTLNMFPRAWQDKIAYMVGEANEVVGAFIRGQFVVMCVLGAIYGMGLWLVGLQLALLLGVIAGLASIVPYLGFSVGIIASGIAAYAQFQDLTVLLWVGLVFGVGQAIESMVLTPILVGDRIGLHPVAVIFALMAGGQIGGFVGVVMALPVAAVIMVFIRHALVHYRASDIYGGE
jgi:predicted PurR-regulated permease PerM